MRVKQHKTTPEGRTHVPGSRTKNVIIEIPEDRDVPDTIIIFPSFYEIPHPFLLHMVLQLAFCVLLSMALLSALKLELIIIAKLYSLFPR